MKTKTKFQNHPFIQFHKRVSVGVLTMLLLLPVVARGGGVVANCTEADLRAAMTGGGTVTFACDGTITLANTITNETDIVLDGTGHQITISGGNSVRVFYVNSNVTFTVRNLTVANGSSAKGAGIFNDGGTLNFFGAVLQRNQARGVTFSQTVFETAEGGGVFNRAGEVYAVNSSFSNNSASQDVMSMADHIPALQARGGAIRNEGGTLNLQDCRFVNNSANGGTPAAIGVPDPGQQGWGGAIHNSGTLMVLRCSFQGNTASGGNGTRELNTTPPYPLPPAGPGGSGIGGAVCNLGTVSIASSAFVGNSVSGGNGASGPSGVSSFPPSYPPSTMGSPGSAGGLASGGAVYNQGTASAVNSTFASNTARGGAGGMGGSGGGTQVRGSSGRDGGAGGDGGSALGGGISGGIALTNCTLAFNSATGGAGALGGSGGYCAYPPGTNGAPGANGVNGVAGGGGINGGSCLNTLLAANASGGNGYGNVADLGHNLSSDGSCNFTNAGSLNNTDPKLGPLADNGGPTLTLALLPGSPAIDAGDTATAPSTDQRGQARPIGSAADIGAFEYVPSPQLSVRSSQPGTVEILLCNARASSCRLFASSNLVNWQCVATNPVGPDGTAMFQDNSALGDKQRFYRVAVP